ncbi:MAG: hypothetical protein JSS61_04770 [Verrucomicrobia bacterium]|nr:hypothetical protein [Verrucomicrobiota bacterium]
MSTTAVTFRARWDATSQHLRTPEPDTLHKVTRVFWNVLSVLIPVIGICRLAGYLLGRVANRLLLPAAHYISDDQIRASRRHFKNAWQNPGAQYIVEEHLIQTPDGAILNAHLLRHRDAGPDTPTVIHFNKNFALSTSVVIPWDLPTPCNFVLFDYRKPYAGTNDLIVDGSSIVQWVREGLKTSPDKIHFYGASLGGAIAAETQALDPEHLVGHHLNERSFASLDAMAGCVLGRILKWQGYHLDAAGAFQKLRGKKCIVYHPHDEVIPYRASLHRAVPHAEAVRLTPLPYDSGHNTPLYQYHAETQKLGEFLCSR